MKKKLNLTLLILIKFLFLNELVFAQSDSLNSFLKQRKDQLEPFDSSKVKIDLESLGLDNVENNSRNFSKNNINQNNPINSNELINNNINNNSSPNQLNFPNTNNNNSQPVKNSDSKSNLINPNATINDKTNSANTKTLNQVIVRENDDNTIKKNPNNLTKTTKKPQSFSKINNAKKRKLAQRLKEEEKKIKSKKVKNITKKTSEINSDEIETPTQSQGDQSEDQENIADNEIPANKISKQDLLNYQKIKNKKLNYLRRIYLGEERDENIQRLQQIDADFIDNDIIKPKPKDLSRFAIHELPAFPILDSFRSQDNYHIPYILTPGENIKMLFDAIKDGDILRFIEIYKLVLNPNIQNQFGDTLLTNAIIARKYTIIAEILSKGADPDLPNRLGYSPCEIALEMNDFRAFQILVENRANINSIDRFGRTYLMHASRLGILPAVDLLVKKGIDINAIDNDGFSALSIAYRHKKEVIVQYLLKNGAKQWVERKNLPEKQRLINELESRWK
jgi:ankyrin repeat protein